MYLNSAEVARFELATCEYLNSLVKEKKIDCDWQIVGGVHPIATRDLLLAVRRRINSIEKHHPDLSGKAQLIESREKLRDLKVQNAIGAVYQPLAAKCWPYKLVAWVLEDLIRRHDVQTFNLQTNTPAQGLQKLQDGGWIVHTDRGQIETKKILLATNAYISQLLPSFTGLVVPTRGQVCALAPPLGSAQLQHSYGWFDNEAGDDYLIHCEDGPLILGGERLLATDNEVGVWQDDEVNEDVGRGLRRAIGTSLKLKENGPEQEQLEAKFEWTGIMGYSNDACPWVGEVPTILGGGEGLWICAGYTGHGMPVAASCGMAVARMMADLTGGVIEIPDVFRITEDRVKRATKMKASRSLADELDILTTQDERKCSKSRLQRQPLA